MRSLIVLILVLLFCIFVFNNNIINSEITGFYFSPITNSTNLYLLKIYNDSGIYNYILKVDGEIKEEAFLSIITGLTQIEIITNASNVLGITLRYENYSYLLWAGFLRNGGKINISAPILPNSTLGITLLVGDTVSKFYFHNIFPYSYYNNTLILNTYKYEILNVSKLEIKYILNFKNINTTFFVKPIILQKLGYLLQYNKNYTILRAYGINSTLIYNFSYYEINGVAYYNLSLFNGKFSEVKKIININNRTIILTDLGFIYIPDQEIVQYHGNLILMEDQTPKYYIFREDGEVYEILNLTNPEYQTFLVRGILITVFKYFTSYPSVLIVPKSLFLNISPSSLIFFKNNSIIIFLEPNVTYYLYLKKLPYVSFSDMDIIITITSIFTLIAILFITKNKLNPNEKK